MRAGKLRNKIVIQKIGTTKNQYGEIEEGNFQTFKTVWGSIMPISGNEKFLSNADFSKVSHRIRIRYIDGVNASMRLLWNGRIFNITYLRTIDEGFREIEIYAWEAINGQP